MIGNARPVNTFRTDYFYVYNIWRYRLLNVYLLKIYLIK